MLWYRNLFIKLFVLSSLSVIVIIFQLQSPYQRDQSAPPLEATMLAFQAEPRHQKKDSGNEQALRMKKLSTEHLLQVTRLRWLSPLRFWFRQRKDISPLTPWIRASICLKEAVAKVFVKASTETVEQQLRATIAVTTSSSLTLLAPSMGLCYRMKVWSV